MKFGIKANIGQFSLLLLLVFFVGVTVGMERNIIPILAKEEFAIASSMVTLSFIASFGFVKAILNLYGGRWSESVGRKKILIAGWLAAVPVPIMIILAPNWWWITLANVLMGINQGLAWTMTVTMKMDISGRKNLGIATGLNEFAGYSGVAFGGIVTGFLAETFGLRPVPFYFGLAVIIVALLISIVFVKETLPYVLKEAEELKDSSETTLLCREKCSLYEIFRFVSWRNKTMFACSQAGAIEKFVDVLVWGFFPIYFYLNGLNVTQIGVVVGVYGFTWGILQIMSGPLSDKIGRKTPIVVGMWTAGMGVAATLWVNGYYNWIITSAITGLGMALLYPTIMAAIGDASHPGWRGTSLGVYRMWRDSGYGFGALLIGFIADIASIRSAFYFVAIAMFFSGALAAVYMRK